MLTGANYEDFRHAWVEFDPEGTGMIEASQLSDLLSTLPPPLGFKDRPAKEKEFMKYMANTNMTVINDSKVHFYEVANALM